MVRFQLLPLPFGFVVNNLGTGPAGADVPDGDGFLLSSGRARPGSMNDQPDGGRARDGHRGGAPRCEVQPGRRRMARIDSGLKSVDAEKYGMEVANLSTVPGKVPEALRPIALPR